MTRKHFKAIADAVASSPLEAIDKKLLAINLANSLAAFNANFKRDRFIAACLKGC